MKNVDFHIFLNIDIIYPATEAHNAPYARGATGAGSPSPNPPCAIKNIPPNIKPTIEAIRRFP